MITLLFLLLTTPLEQFQQLQGEDPWLEFNKGSCYVNLDDPAWALYHYERAHRLLPRNREITQHRNRACNTLTVTPHPTRLLTLERWLSPFERNLLLFTLGASATLLYFLNRRLALIPLTGALLLTASLLYGELASPTALLVRSSLLHGQANEDSSSTLLKSGTYVRIHAAHDDYLEVELPDGREGLISAHSVAIL
jgi:hypothetical protein